jgi:succinate dehydrogenase / fumarate reductase flavoprotein subunit
LADTPIEKIPVDHPEFKKVEKEVYDKINKLLNIKGKRSVDHFHKKLGKIMWEYCGMARNVEGLSKAKSLIKELKKEYWVDVRVIGTSEELNLSLEKAHRVADFIELAELMVDDALHRNESCGGHFREEYQTAEGEALRDDENFSYVAAWKFVGENVEEELHKESLEFENVKLTQRSYK